MTHRYKAQDGRLRSDEGREGKVSVAGYLDPVGLSRAWRGDEVAPFVRPIPFVPPGYRQEALEWADHRDVGVGVFLAEPGRLFQVYGSLVTNADPTVFLLFDSDQPPQAGDFAVAGFIVPDLSNFSFDFGIWGRYFRKGIAWGLISTQPPSAPWPGGVPLANQGIVSAGFAREREVVR